MADREKRRTVFGSSKHGHRGALWGVGDADSGIGEVARRYGITPRTLRFYEQLGLIEGRRDRLNMRRYDETALRRIHWIVRLRAAGLRLAPIAEVLSEANEVRWPEEAHRALARRRAALAAQLAQAEQFLAEMRPMQRPQLRLVRKPVRLSE